jgi:hypothetical protein
VFWSHSALAQFETCPRQYYEVRIRKSTAKQNYEASEGVKKHKEIELYLLDNTPVASPEIKAAMGVIEHFKNMPGKLYPEHRMALTEQLKPTEFTDWNNAWLRAIADLLVVNGDTATIADWKFGKPRDGGDDQLRLTAAVAMTMFPRVEQVQSVLVYVNGQTVSPTYVYERTYLPEIWQGFTARYSVLLRAVRSIDPSVWVPRPSGLCRKYCPVKTCEFNGDYVP